MPHASPQSMSLGPQNILVATDFAPASSRAVEAACALAGRFGAKLTVIHVIESSGHGWAAALPPEVRRSAAFRLDELLKGVSRHVARVESCLREGLAWQEITRAAVEIGAELVVIGSNGGSRDPHFQIGSVAERVVRSCPAPVLTVHAWRFDDRAQAGRELAEILLRTNEQRPFIVALSPAGAAVAAEIAEAFGTPLHVSGVEQARTRGPQGDRGETRSLQLATWEPAATDDALWLVSDAILDAAPTVAAAKALRQRGARRILAVAPVAARTALASVAEAVDQSVVLQVVDDDTTIEQIYRDSEAPSRHAIGARAASTACWAEAVGSPATRAR